MDVDIVNIVVTGKLDFKKNLKYINDGILDIPKLKKCDDGKIFKKSPLYGMVYRKNEKQPTVLLFKTGKIICVGSKTLEDTNTCISNFQDEVKTYDLFLEKDITIRICNIVAVCKFDYCVNLDILYDRLEGSEYDAATSVILEYKPEGLKTLIRVFRSGKCVILAAKTIEDVYKTAEKMEEKISELDAWIKDCN